MESIKELRKICQNLEKYYNTRFFLDNKILGLFSMHLNKIFLYTILTSENIKFVKYKFDKEFFDAISF